MEACRVGIREMYGAFAFRVAHRTPLLPLSATTPPRNHGEPYGSLLSLPLISAVCTWHSRVDVAESACFRHGSRFSCSLLSLSFHPSLVGDVFATSRGEEQSGVFSIRRVEVPGDTEGVGLSSPDAERCC